ncbi:MAG: hypothetical protein ABI330_13460, partial [Caldimonas sp.]
MHQVTFVAAALAFSGMAAAQTAPTPRLVFSCIDANGKKHTSDRPIPDCNDRDQRLLNPDGSFNKIRPPPPTADETAEMEAKEREANAQRVARNDAIRRDRNL